MKATKAQRAESLEILRDIVKPGDTLYTILRHVSSSGMYRVIDVYKMESVKGEVVKHWLSYHIARVLDYRFSEKHEAVGVGGCGMDMGFSVVYNVSRALYAQGYKCLGKKCPSNSHVNSPAKPKIKGRYTHTDGYAVSQKWL